MTDLKQRSTEPPIGLGWSTTPAALARHRSVLCLNDGGVVRGPVSTPQPVLEVRVDDGRVLVRSTPH